MTAVPNNDHGNLPKEQHFLGVWVTFQYARAVAPIIRAMRSPSYQLLRSLAVSTVSHVSARMAKMMKTVTVRTVTVRPEKSPLLVPWQSAYC